MPLGQRQLARKLRLVCVTPPVRLSRKYSMTELCYAHGLPRIAAFVCHAPPSLHRPRQPNVRARSRVSGQGEVQAEPDRALVTLGAESRKPKMEEARADVAKRSMRC